MEPEPERAALGAVLLFLISEDKISVARSGGTLGLGRMAAVRWYTSRGLYYPDLSEEDLAEDPRHARKP